MTALKGKLLYVTEDGQGLLFKNQAFYTVNLTSGQSDLIVNTQAGFWERICGHSRLGARFFRMEPRCVERLLDNLFVVCYANRVWLLDALKRSLSLLLDSRDGFSNPLNLCTDGNAVYWGDYGNNPKHEVVNIYRLDSDLKVKIAYSFEEGVIRHIHNIVWDEKHQKFYVLTGDLEEKSGIYEATVDWHQVSPIVTGDQQFRAVVAFLYKDGLIYATDSVSEKNMIYLLQNGTVKPLSPLPGSCIYGAETEDYYVFSTTVEPPEGRGLFDMLTYKLGEGIEDRYSHLIAVGKNDLKVREVAKVKKDILPMKLFQYGAVMFPQGRVNENTIWLYNMACKGDGRTIAQIIEG